MSQSTQDGSPLPESYLHFVIPLSCEQELDCEWFMRRFQQRWGERAVCAENPQWALPERGLRKYMVLDAKKNAMLVTVIQEPLPATLNEVVLQAAPEIDGDEKLMLLNHRATILLDYALGSDAPPARTMFSAKVLLTLMALDSALGYVVKAAQSYRTANWLAKLGLEDEPELNEAHLLFLLTTKHVVDEESKTWLHTHGMEQFELPDMEVRIPRGEEGGYWIELVDNLALYMVERGPVVKPGHTISLTGDNDVLVVRDTDIPEEFGRFGALRIEKVPPTSLN